MPAKTISSMATTSLGFVSLARCFAGGIMLLTPHLGGQFFGIPINSESRIFGRLFGVRDLTLGVLLWKFSSTFHLMGRSEGNANHIIQSATDLKAVLAVGVIIDSIDVVSCLVSAYYGEVEGKALFWGPFGAGVFAVLQWFARREI